VNTELIHENLDEAQEVMNAERMAKILSKSNLVPQAFKGKWEDCLIAASIAKDVGMNPINVMTCLHIIHGKPSWSSQGLIALFNSIPHYTSIVYEEENVDTKEWSCVAVTSDQRTGKEIRGPRVSLEMARQENWSTKPGSKWKTMPGLMLRYRAAAFLIRSTAPEVGLGLYTSDEIQDIQVNQEQPPARVQTPKKVSVSPINQPVVVATPEPLNRNAFETAVSKLESSQQVLQFEMGHTDRIDSLDEEDRTYAKNLLATRLADLS